MEDIEILKELKKISSLLRKLIKEIRALRGK